MKKTIALLSLSALAAGVLVGCATGKPGDSNLPGGQENSQTSGKEVFLTQAVTGLQLAAPSSLKAAPKHKAAPANDQEIAALKEVLPTVDLLFDNGKAFDSQVETVNRDVEGVVYEFEEKITHLGADLKEVTYTLLYNKEAIAEEQEDEEETPVKKAAETSSEATPAPENTETTPAPEGTETTPAPEGTETTPAPENSDSLPQEIEREWRLSGYAYLDEETRFPFEAKIEEEQEGQEAELERFFRIDTGVDSRILVKEEFEVEGLEKEQELRYTVVEEGKIVSDYKIELESEGKENEIEIEVDGQSFEIERKETEEGVFYEIERKSEAGKIVASFKKVVDEAGNVTYEAI